MKLLKYILLSHLLLTIFSSQAQEEIHYSYWHDEYTIQTHITPYIANLVAPHQGMKTWDAKQEKYVSYVPDGLTYLPAAGKTLTFKLAIPTHHLTAYFAQNWANFSEAHIDSIFQLGKQVEAGSLQYDQQGRLTHVYRKSKEHRLTTEKDEVNIRYEDTQTGSRLFIELSSNSFNWFANYSSIYVGNIRWRPLRLTSNWKMKCNLHADGMLEHVTSTSRGFANGSVNHGPSDYLYDFVWDKKGRMLERQYLVRGDSFPKKTENTYVERPFAYDTEAKRYPLLQVPSIQKWLFKNFDHAGLRMVNSQIDGSIKTFLMYRTKTLVLKLDTSQYFRQFVYYTLADSVGTFRVKAEINKMPDLKDTIPYDSHFKARLIEKQYTPTSVEQIYTQPHGTMLAGRINLYRRSVTPLNDGWKLIRYQRGSAVTMRFAVGYQPPARLDVMHDKYVMVDEQGRVRYYYSYKRLYQIAWP